MHLAALRRLHPQPPCVDNIGHARFKSRWVSYTYNSMNFSFILRGEGRYQTATRTWPVHAPCVITQWPGVQVDYGPDKTWEEVFLIYDPKWMPVFEERGYAEPERPVWYIHDTQRVWNCIDGLRAAFERLTIDGWADRVDRLCESLILESLLSPRQDEDDPKAQAIRAICAVVESDIAGWHDFHQMAADRGLSPATFRRQWARQIGVPPGQYLTRLRIQQACRLLSETGKTVHEIARQCGFDDPLYFSRKFRQVVGQAATDYRQQHRQPAILSEAQPDE